MKLYFTAERQFIIGTTKEIHLKKLNRDFLKGKGIVTIFKNYKQKKFLKEIRKIEIDCLLTKIYLEEVIQNKNRNRETIMQSYRNLQTITIRKIENSLEKIYDIEKESYWQIQKKESGIYTVLHINGELIEVPEKEFNRLFKKYL